MTGQSVVDLKKLELNYFEKKDNVLMLAGAGLTAYAFYKPGCQKKDCFLAISGVIIASIPAMKKIELQITDRTISIKLRTEFKHKNKLK